MLPLSEINHLVMFVSPQSDLSLIGQNGIIKQRIINLVLTAEDLGIEEDQADQPDV